jgi:hypothetical protein
MSHIVGLAEIVLWTRDRNEVEFICEAPPGEHD